MKKLITFLMFMICPVCAFCDGGSVDACMRLLSADTESGNLSSAVQSVIGTTTNATVIAQKREQILEKMADAIREKCADSLNDIADVDNVSVILSLNNKRTKLNFKTVDIFDYLVENIGILVYGPAKLNIGDTVKNDSISDYYWSNECSAHTPGWLISDKNPVNRAGKAAFTTYGDAEFFLDFPKGKVQRTFPGIVIADTSKFVLQNNAVVFFPNRQIARRMAQTFAKNLAGTACSNGLSVYLVDISKLSDSPGFWRQVRTAMYGVPALGRMDAVTVLSEPFRIR